MSFSKSDDVPTPPREGLLTPEEIGAIKANILQSEVAMRSLPRAWMTVPDGGSVAQTAIGLLNAQACNAVSALRCIEQLQAQVAGMREALKEAVIVRIEIADIGDISVHYECDLCKGFALTADEIEHAPTCVLFTAAKETKQS